MSLRTPLLLTALLVLVLPIAAQQAEDAEPVERITIIGTYDPLDPRSVPEQVTVIGPDEIRAAGARNAAELVAPALGVQVDRHGGVMAPSVVSIRGSSPEQVLVLVNGKRLNSAQGGGVDLSTIPPESIERIEIVRGGGGAAYGEGALGGVVNIVTRDGYGQQAEGRVRYGYGSFGTHRVDASVLGPLGADNRLDGFLAVGGLYTDGVYSFADPNESDGISERANTQGWRADTTAKLGWTIDPTRGLRLSLLTQTHNDRKGSPGLKEFPTDSAELTDERYLAALTLAWMENPVAETTLDLYGIRHRRGYEDPDYAFGAVDDAHDNGTLGADLTLEREDAVGFARFRSTVAYHLRHDRLESTALIRGASGDEGEGVVTRTAHGASLRSEIHVAPYQSTGIGRVTLFPAFRYDYTTIADRDAGNTRRLASPSTSLGLMVPFAPDADTVLKGNVGTAYRIPSFDDLFWPSTAFAVGNPDLDPEEAVFYDVGLLVRPYPFFSLEIVHFAQDVENLIQWNPGAGGVWRPENIGSALLTGLESEVKLLFDLPSLASLLELKANYTYLFAKDMTSGSPTRENQLPRRPHERANVVATLTHYDGHLLRLEGRFVGFRYTTAQNTKSLPSYVVLDATASARLAGRYTLTAAARNLLDEEYVDLREFPVPGRELEVALEVAF